MVTRTRKMIFLWICSLLLLCMTFGALTFFTQGEAVAQEGGISLQAAFGTAARYKAVTEIEDGSTIVFSANIGTGGEKDGTQFINQQDRLLKSAMFPNAFEEDVMTETVIEKNGDFIDFNDTQGFTFLVEKAEGMTNEGDQGYYLKTLTGISKNCYLDVKQDIAYMDKTPRSNITIGGGNKVGTAWVTQPFVYLSPYRTRVWYWDATEHSFYVLYTTNVSSLGYIREADDGENYYFIQGQGQGNLYYYVNWISGSSYIYGSKEELFGNTGYYFVLMDIEFPPANTKFTLIGSNPPPENCDGISINMGLILLNPYYYYKARTGSTPTTKASLGIIGGISVEYLTGMAEKADLKVYQKIENSALTVEGGTGSGDYGYGQTVTITADGPDSSCHFYNWTIVSGNAQIASPNNAQTTVVLYDENVVIRAQTQEHYLSDTHDCTQDVTCAACGYLFEEGLPAHDYEYNQYQKTVVQDGKEVVVYYHTITCRNKCYDGQNCAVTSEEPCSGGTATCTERAVCATCGKEYGELAEHTPEVIAGKAATCTETGLTDGSKCSVCGTILEEQQIIPALGHDYTGVEPEWSWNGFASAWASFKCAREGCDHIEICSASLTNEVTTASTCEREGVRTYTATARFGDEEFTSAKAETLEKLPHTPQKVESTPPTCTETGLSEGSICSVCRTILKEQQVIPVAEHSYVPSVTQPTCTEQGYTTFTCSVCGHSYKDNYVEALGHDLVPHDGKELTCTEQGWSDYYTCGRCDYTTYEELPATGHSYGDWIVTKQPARTEQGEREKVCEHCGNVISEAIPANGNEDNPDGDVAIPGQNCSGCGSIDGGDMSIIGITLAIVPLMMLAVNTIRKRRSS